MGMDQTWDKHAFGTSQDPFFPASHCGASPPLGASPWWSIWSIFHSRMAILPNGRGAINRGLNRVITISIAVERAPARPCIPMQQSSDPFFRRLHATPLSSGTVGLAHSQRWRTTGGNPVLVKLLGRQQSVASTGGSVSIRQVRGLALTWSTSVSYRFLVYCHSLGHPSIHCPSINSSSHSLLVPVTSHQSLARLFIHSFIHPFIHSFIHLFIHSYNIHP